METLVSHHQGSMIFTIPWLHNLSQAKKNGKIINTGEPLLNFFFNVLALTFRLEIDPFFYDWFSQKESDVSFV